MVRVIVEELGIFLFSITTSTAEVVLSVMSGNVLGFGVMDVPFMLITLATGGPAVGRRSGKGVDVTCVPWKPPINPRVLPSSRTTPGPPIYDEFPAPA